MVSKSRAEQLKRSIALIVTDCTRKIMWVNDDFTTITGYSFQEVYGKKPSILKGKNTESEAINRIRKCLELQFPFHDRITNYRKNGEEYSCILSIHPIFGEEGLLSNYIALKVDSDYADHSTIESLKVKQKYITSNLKSSDELLIYSKLQDFFTKEKPFLDAHLSLSQIARYLGTNERYLSQVINKQTGENFRYFVNRYRIREFEAIIAEQKMKHLTLYGVAEHCGFKNKATFYNVVVYHTGLTPKGLSNRYKALIKSGNKGETN